MRILVTGGAGYIGSVLCEHLLNSGFEVVVIDSLMYGQASLSHLCHFPGFEFVRGDVRDPSLVKRSLSNCDVIIPLAAIVGAKACDLAPQTASAVNLDSIRLLNKLRGQSQPIIFPVTNSGYGTVSGEVHCTEETPLQPISLYGQTKVEAEDELLQSGSVVTLRFATIFGMSPRMRLDLLVNHFVYAAVTDGYLVIFEKDFKRNYLHIRDAADCFLYSIKNFDNMANRPYNVGLDNANLSKEELALAVRNHVPDFYLHFSEIGSDPDKRNYIVSNQRLREVGFEARRTIDDGVRELIKGYAMMGRATGKNA